MRPRFSVWIKQAWRIAKPVLSLVVSIGLLLFVFTRVDWGELWSTLSDLRFRDFAVALLLMVAADFFMGLKSWFLKPEMPVLRVVGTTLTSKFFSLLPGGNIAGETVRLLHLREMMGMQTATAMLIIDKQSHMIPAMVLCFIGLLHPSVTIPGIFYLFALLALLWPFIFPGPLFIPGVRRWAKRNGNKLLRFKWGKPFNDQIVILSDACEILVKNPRSLIFHLACGFLGELCTISMMIFLAHQLEFPVPAWDFLWLNGFMLVAMVIPFSVMGMGVREGAMVYLLGWWSIDVSRAMTLPLVISSLTIIKGLLYAPVSPIETRRRRLREK